MKTYLGTIWRVVSDGGRQHDRRRRVVEAGVANDLIRRVDELEAAIAVHRDSIEQAGPVTLESRLTRNQVVILHAMSAADRRLWRMIA